jgi:hypothetical protein
MQKCIRLLEKDFPGVTASVQYEYVRNTLRIKAYDDVTKLTHNYELDIARHELDEYPFVESMRNVAESINRERKGRIAMEATPTTTTTGTFKSGDIYTFPTTPTSKPIDVTYANELYKYMNSAEYQFDRKYGPKTKKKPNKKDYKEVKGFGEF